jgi:hypothetical protein
MVSTPTSDSPIWRTHSQLELNRRSPQSYPRSAHPYVLVLNDHNCRINYEPAESTSGLFGGNSNWRGPIWFPVNYLIVEALLTFHHYLGDESKIECPTGSGQWMTFEEVAIELAQRLMRIFLADARDCRPVFGSIETLQTNPHWRDLILFHE